MDEIDDLVEGLTQRVEALEREWVQARAQVQNGDEADAQGDDISRTGEKEDELEELPEPEQAGRRFGRLWRR